MLKVNFIIIQRRNQFFLLLYRLWDLFSNLVLWEKLVLFWILKLWLQLFLFDIIRLAYYFYFYIVFFIWLWVNILWPDRLKIFLFYHFRMPWWRPDYRARLQNMSCWWCVSPVSQIWLAFWFLNALPWDLMRRSFISILLFRNWLYLLVHLLLHLFTFGGCLWFLCVHPVLVQNFKFILLADRRLPLWDPYLGPFFLLWILYDLLIFPLRSFFTLTFHH